MRTCASYNRSTRATQRSASVWSVNARTSVSPDGVEVLDQRDVLRRVHGTQVRDHRAEVVERHGAGRQRGGHVGHHLRRLVHGPSAVVQAVDAHGVEPVRHRLDLAQEVLRGEAALAQASRGVFDVAAKRVPVSVSSLMSRVITIVSPGSSSLELVDAHQCGAAEQVDRPLEPQGAHERGVLDEGAERLPPGGRVVGGCEQVGLADTEPAVQVHAGLRRGLRRLLPAPEQPAPRGLRGTGGHERGDGIADRGLRVVVRVRPVRVERRVRELGRWHERRGHLPRGHLGITVDEVSGQSGNPSGKHVVGCHVASGARYVRVPLPTGTDARS